MKFIEKREIRVDVKNVNYAISLDDVTLWTFLVENNINYLTGMTYVISSISDSTYGVVYNANDKLVFCKHKAIEINKSKSVPKVVTKIQKNCKFITKDELNKYFRQSNSTEIMYFEMREENELFNKKGKINNATT